MTILKTTPEEMKSKATSISSEVAKIKRSFLSIDKTVSGTNRYWQGDASKTHISRYSEYKTEFELLMPELAVLSDILLQVAGLYVETENENQQLAQSLPTDIF